MTIGIGFLCEDGIVLCADNQITWPMNHKYYERKIYPHAQGDWLAVFTFAGNPNLMKSFNDKFRETMKLIPGPHTAAMVQKAIETVLSLMDTIDNDQDGLHMMCGIVIPNSEMRLLKTERKVVRQEHRHDYVGVGDSSLLRFLEHQIAANNIETKQQALVWGIFLVLAAKRYVDGCGGDTDAVVLKPNGHLEHFGTTYDVEQHFLRLEHHARNVALTLVGSSDDESVKEFEDYLERLCQQLRSDRQKYSRH